MRIRGRDDGMAARSEGLGRTALAAVWSIATASVGMVVAMEGAHLSADQETGARRVSVLALFGVATSLLLVAFEALTRRGGRRGVATITATAGWVVVVFVGLEINGDRLYERGFHLFFDAAPWLVYATPLVVAIAFALSFWLSWRGRIARFDRLRRRSAVAALGLTAVVAAIALGRSRRPDPDTYWPSLPVVGTLAVDVPMELPDRRRLTLAPDACNPIAWAPGDEGSAPGCRVSGIRAPCVTCATLTVRHDALSDFYWLFGEGRRPALVFKGTDVEARKVVRVRDLEGVLGPPIAWTLGISFGVAMAGALALGAWGIERRRAALVANAEARSEGEAEAAEVLDLRAARLYALAATTCVLCAGPLIIGAALGQW
jgi:hypothetical protein